MIGGAIGCALFELAIQLLELTHESVRKKLNGNSGLAQLKHSSAENIRVRVQHANYNFGNPTFYQPLSTWHFRMIARGAGLKCRVDGASRQRCIF